MIAINKDRFVLRGFGQELPNIGLVGLLSPFDMASREGGRIAYIEDEGRPAGDQIAGEIDAHPLEARWSGHNALL